MPRIRTIKPELREWAPFACLTDGAARLFLMLYTLADDEGRCPAGASYLAGAVFFGRPRSPNVVGRLLAELEHAQLIDRYSWNGAPFLEIVGWRAKDGVTQGVTHQRIEKTQGAKYPTREGVHSRNGSGNQSGNGSVPHSVTDRDMDLDRENDRDREEDPRGSASPRLPVGSAASFFSEHYARANGGNAPTWNAKNRKRLADLVIEHGEHEVERRIRIMFTSPPKWPPPPYDVATFATHFDKFASPTNGRADISKFTDDDYLAPSPAFPNMVNANDFGGPEDPC